MSANLTLPPRQMARVIAAAATGGFAGTVLRDVLTGLEHLPPPTSSVSWTQEIPWVLLVINFIGVLLATHLLRGRLRARDSNDLARVLVITGFFGGLTSYSTLYVDLATLWHVSASGAVTVAFGALTSGVAAAWLGLRRHRP